MPKSKVDEPKNEGQWVKITIRFHGSTSLDTVATVLNAMQYAEASVADAAEKRYPIVLDARQGSILLTILAPAATGAAWWLKNTESGKAFDARLKIAIEDMWDHWWPRRFPPRHPPRPNGPPKCRAELQEKPETHPDSDFGGQKFRVVGDVLVDIGDIEEEDTPKGGKAAHG
jgi:hypothetical protein